MSSSSTEMAFVPVQVEDSENDSTISSLSSVSGFVTKRAILAGLAVLTAVAVLAVGVYALAGAAPRCPEADARAGHDGRQLSAMAGLQVLPVEEWKTILPVEEWKTITSGSKTGSGIEDCGTQDFDSVFSKWMEEHDEIKITHHATRKDFPVIDGDIFRRYFNSDTRFVDKFEKIVRRSGDVVTALDIFRTQLFVTKRQSHKWDYEVTRIILGDIIIGENGDTTTEWNKKELIWRDLHINSPRERKFYLDDSPAVVFKIEGIKKIKGINKIKGIKLKNKFEALSLSSSGSD